MSHVVFILTVRDQDSEGTYAFDQWTLSTNLSSAPQVNTTLKFERLLLPTSVAKWAVTRCRLEVEKDVWTVWVKAVYLGSDIQNEYVFASADAKKLRESLLLLGWKKVARAVGGSRETLL